MQRHSLKLGFAAWIVTFFGFTSSVWATSELYLEQVLQGEETRLSNSTRIRHILLDGVAQPFIQLGNENQSYPERWGTFAPSSHAYFSGGLRVPLTKPFVLISEVRQRFYYSSSNELPERDARLLVTVGDLRLLSSTLFVEYYSEHLLSSADDFNLIHSALFRIGPRLTVSRSLLLDFFAEPFATLDWKGRDYNNRAELRLGTRLQTSGNWRGSLLLSYVQGGFLPFKRFSRLDFDSRFGGVRALLLFGGSF